MEGAQPAKLSDEARNSFASAVAAQPEEGAEAAVATEPVPESGSSPATETTTENVGSTETTQEATVPDQPVEGDERPAEEAPKGPIPYDRFKAINDAKKLLEEEVKTLKSRGVDPALLDQMASDRARAQLASIAAQHPELQKVIFGDPTQPAQPKTTANLPPLDLNDPVQARMAIVEASQRAIASELQDKRRQELISDMQTRAETRMETHQVFKDADFRTVGETLIAQRLVQDAKTPVDTVVDDVAKMLRNLQEKSKAAYVKPKVEAPKKIPAGVGGGNAAPPGAPAGQKFAFGGSARKGLEAAIRGDQQA